MKILYALLVTLAVLLTGISAVAGFFVLFAEASGSQFYRYTRASIMQVEQDPERGEVAVIRFQTQERVPITAEIANSFPHYQVGETVSIKYRPEHPKEAYNASFAANGLLGVILLWFAALCIVLVSAPQVFRRYVWRQVAISLRLQRRKIVVTE